MFDFNQVYTPLTKAELLCHIDSETIFHHYFGDFKLRKVYSSPLRTDKNPSFGFFYNRAGELVSNDIVTREKLDAIAFVAKLHNISYKDAILKIAHDFNITCNTLMSKVEINKITKSINNGEKTKRKTKIQIVPKPFTKQDLEYWEQWEITEKELVRENAFSVEKLYIDGERIPLKGMVFAFYQKDPDTDEGYFKILQPESKTHKWISNIPLSLFWGADRLPKQSSQLIISKSWKDRICLMRFFSDVIATQNESLSAMMRCTNFIKDYEETIVIWDSDDPGVKACSEVTKTYGLKYWNTPSYLKEQYKVKDVAEYVENFGYDALEKRLKESKILK